MLLAIRERIMGFLGWVILGLLCIAFAFWGIASYLTSSTVNYAASVNDVEISPRQHENAYRALVNRMRESLGSDYERSGLDEETLRAAALKRLISDELVIQAAEAAGFAVGEKHVAARINAVDAFKKDGLFSSERYNQILRNQGMSPAQFEWQLRRETIANQLKIGIARTASTTGENLSRIFRLQGQQRRFDYLVLPSASVAEQVVIGDEDLDNYYTRHPDEFLSREQARVQYVELDAAGLELDGMVNEGQIEALYEEQAERFITPEERHARHILISTPDTSDDAMTAARIKAEETAGRLAAGEDFETVAGEVSDDPATAASGGDLGFFVRGTMTPKFEEAVFAMQVDERSKPVQSDYGFHLIELLDIRPEVATPLAEVRDELVVQLQGDERADLFYEKSELLANTAFEQPDSLQGVAEMLDIDLLESDWIGRDGGPGIGGNEDVVAALYGEDVLQNGNNSTTIEVGENHVVVVRVLEYQEAKQQPLDEVRENVRNSVTTQKVRELLEKTGEDYLVDLNQGNTVLADVAGTSGQTLEQSPLIDRTTVNPERTIVSKVFSMRVPQADKPVYSGFILPGGDYAIVALHEVQDGSLDSLTKEQRTQAERGLNRILGASDVELVLGEIKKNASIHIPDNPDQ